MTYKGFVLDLFGNILLPITRAELVLDSKGEIALLSNEFLAGGTLGKENNLPGLITAAERAMLRSDGPGGGIADIYKKLEYINKGLKVGNNILSFYSEDENNQLKSTPILLRSIGEGVISVTSSGQYIDFNLAKLNETPTEVTNIIKSINVDEYGRVTSVSGSALTNDDIPTEITGKTFDSCKTSTSNIGTEDTAIVNKAYVDSKFDLVNVLATGALQFKGSINTLDRAIEIILDILNKNYYYKVTSEFTIPSDYMYAEQGVSFNTPVRYGDTLIVYPINDSECKFVHVPSGNEITSISVQQLDNPVPILLQTFGPVTFIFDKLFSVTGDNGYGNSSSVNILFPPVSNTLDGYLTKDDYQLFKSYSSNLLVSYESSIDNSQTSYKIGTITIGSKPYDINGLNNTYDLSLSEDEIYKNPILKFTGNGIEDYSIAFKSLGGIAVNKKDESIEFKAVIKNESTKYLKINDRGEFEVIIGGKSLSNEIVNGLTDYKDFIESTTSFMIINTSLTDDTKTYHYGSEALRNAIAPEGFEI